MFHLCKSVRVYDGKPYCGPSSKYELAQAATLEEASRLADLLQCFNPVGWEVYDSETGELRYTTPYGASHEHA